MDLSSFSSAFFTPVRNKNSASSLHLCKMRGTVVGDYMKVFLGSAGFSIFKLTSLTNGVQLDAAVSQAL